MLGSTVGEPPDARRALAYGRSVLAKAIVIGICVTLILLAIVVPIGAVFAILVTVHRWQLGIIVMAVPIDRPGGWVQRRSTTCCSSSVSW